MSCIRGKHAGTIVVTETGTWVTEHMVEPDGEVWHDNEPGNYSPIVSVRCEACGTTYRGRQCHAPRWVRRACDAALTADKHDIPWEASGEC